MQAVKTATAAWLDTLALALHGDEVSPRGKLTRELPQHTVVINTWYPLVSVPARKLSVRFAAAEALWILSGDNRVEPLAKFAPRMREFSDDGVTLAGAYGPRVVEQLDYVVRTLRRDRDTRQAVLTMWKPCPAPSKDIPCTVALDFKIRGDKLNCHAFMRSSDVWLGLPYDAFSFAMITCYVATAFNNDVPLDATDTKSIVYPGRLYVTAASSHLYAENWDAARAILEHPMEAASPQPPLDAVFVGDWVSIEAWLLKLRDHQREGE